MRLRRFTYILLLFIISGCSKSNDNTTQPSNDSIYFPPLTGTTWESATPESLKWKSENISPLYNYLESKHTKSFIVLYNGKIVIEKYFGSHTSTTPWYWASAGKTLTSSIVGIANEEKLLNINNKVSDYLGTGWTTAPLAKENLITCKHLLSMTSGLDDAYNDNSNEALHDCVSPDCLVYKADAGTRWAYDNVYVKLQDVVAKASGKTWSSYFNDKLRDKIGMTGTWIQTGNMSVYWSHTRSMARFGLLAYANGKWNDTQVIPSGYFEQAVNTSQNINLSYGYLWWLNGKSSYRLPQSQLQINRSLVPNAPADMFCALGKNDQKIYVVPSKKLVVIRMGDAADELNWALSQFDNELWAQINTVIQ